MDSQVSKVKIAFPLPPEEGYPRCEHMWAEVGDDSYTVLNIPFFTRGVHMHDQVYAVESSDYPLEFVGVKKPGGHETLIAFFKEDQERQDLILALEELGCSFEGGFDSKMLAIDLPPTASLENVEELLDDFSDRNQIEWFSKDLQESLQIIMLSGCYSAYDGNLPDARIPIHAIGQVLSLVLYQE